MKKYFKIVIPILIFFVGLKVNAQTEFRIQGIEDNVVVYNQSGTDIDLQGTFYNNPWSWRFYIGNWNEIVANTTYTINLNYSIRQMDNTTVEQCGLNINGAYVGTNGINAARIGYEGHTGNYLSRYAVTTSYTATNNITGNPPIYIQCDHRPIASKWTKVTYAVSVTASGQSTGNNSDIINAINNNGNNIVNNNNYNANQNNANRDSNTDRIINNQNQNTQNIIDGQHSLASEVINNGLVCNVQHADLTFKYQDLGIKNVYLNSYGVSESDNNFNSSDFIEVGSDQTISLYKAGSGSSSTTDTKGLVHIIRYDQNKTRIGDSTVKNIKSNQAWQAYWDANTKYIRLSIKNDIDIRIVGYLYKCDKGMQKVADEQNKQTGFLSQIKDGINSTYNLINTTISNILGGIGTGIQNIWTWLTDTTIDTSAINTLINRIKESNPPIFSILTSLKNFVQSFGVSQSQCQSLSIPIKDTNKHTHNIIIPCGTTLFWDRQDVADYKIWWNLFIGGIILYRVGFRLIKVFNDAFDPTKDELGKGLEI